MARQKRLTCTVGMINWKKRKPRFRHILGVLLIDCYRLNIIFHGKLKWLSRKIEKVRMGSCKKPKHFFPDPQKYYFLILVKLFYILEENSDPYFWRQYSNQVDKT